MNQRQRRAELLKKWKAVRLLVILRDRGKCVICGNPAVTVNHILSRGAHPSLFILEKNLASLCKVHDSEFTNTKDFAKLQISTLKERHGYTYDEPEFREVLDA